MSTYFYYSEEARGLVSFCDAFVCFCRCDWIQ